LPILRGEDTLTCMNEKTIGRIDVGEDRELRVSQVEAENLSFLRIGTYIISTDTPVTTVTIPPRVVDRLVNMLNRVKR
jgi:hypothetical protein